MVIRAVSPIRMPKLKESLKRQIPKKGNEKSAEKAKKKKTFYRYKLNFEAEEKVLFVGEGGP
jgi:hypothetical protein